MMQNSAPTGKPGAQSQPRRELFARPRVHADLAALAAFAVAHEDRAAGEIKIALGEGKRFADLKAGAPKHDDQSAHPDAVGAIAGATHDRDDLLDHWRVGRIALSLVAWRTAAVVTRQRGG